MLRNCLKINPPKKIRNNHGTIVFKIQDRLSGYAGRA